MLPPQSGGHSLERWQVEKCWEVLWLHFGTSDPEKRRIAEGFYERQSTFSFDVWMAAIREAYRRGKTAIRDIGYIEAIAGDYAKKGIPRREPKEGEPLLPAKVKYHKAERKLKFPVNPDFKG